ncbi:MAG TPA: transposase [Caldilineae bacterium]|nr:transposase [Caldilineae bacterium]
MLDRLLEEEQGLPRKQRYTGKKLFELIQAAGYAGAESTVRRYVGAQRKRQRRPRVYAPLAFEPGEDAQVDWGTGWVELAGELTEVQLFVMRMNYSRKLFVMAFPTQRQEAFFDAHVQAFAFFGGVPKRITYDNLTTAVKRIVKEGGREDHDQQAGLPRARGWREGIGGLDDDQVGSESLVLLGHSQLRPGVGRMAFGPPPQAVIHEIEDAAKHPVHPGAMDADVGP